MVDALGPGAGMPPDLSRPAAAIVEVDRPVRASPRTATVATGLSLLVPITLSTMAIVLLAPVLPKLQQEFAGAPHADYLVPIVLTMPALCVALLSPIAGALGDYFGRRRLLLAAFALYGVVGLAPIFLTNLTAILASRVLVGIAEALIMVLSTTMIGDYFSGESRDRWLAGQTAAASLSALVFFNLGGVLGESGWRTPFWVYSSAFLMLAAVATFTWDREAQSDAGGEATHLHNVSWADFPWRAMTGILGVTIFASVLFYTVQIHAAPGLVALGLQSSARIGFLTSIASLGVPLGTVIYSRAPQTRTPILLTIEFAMLAVGFFVMSHASTPTGFLIGCGLNQVGAGMILPTLLVWAVSKLSFEVRSRGTGLWTAAFSLGQFLSPIVVTFISRRAGGLLPAFAWLSYAALAALLVALLALAARPTGSARAAA